MVDKKISDFTEIAEVDIADNDMIPIIDVSVVAASRNKKVSVASMKNVSSAAALTAATAVAAAKGKVIYQNAAPAVGDQLSQNLWVDTTAGANTPKRWNGTAWVAVTDKVASDAAAAAAAAAAVAAAAQPGDPDLTALAALTGAADTMPYFTGPGAAALTPITPAARALMDDTTRRDQVETLGLQIAVARIGAAVTMTLNLQGTVTGVVTKDIELSQIYQARVYQVPRIGAALQLSMDNDGNIIDGISKYGDPINRYTPGDPVEIGLAEVRAVPGIVTGRSLDQLHVRRSAAVFVPVTGGPDPVRLISVDPTAGLAVVSRGGKQTTVNWRTTPLGVGDDMHMLLIMGQSLAQGHTDTLIPERVPSWRDPFSERAWQFRAGDGVQRGPRPLQVTPVVANKDVQVASSQLLSLEPLRGASHAYFEQQGQTCAETAALALIGQHLDHREHVLGCVIGTGSTAIADFAPGTEHDLSARAAISAAKNLAALMNKNLKVWFIWNQGEQDNTNGTAQASYESAFNTIRTGLTAYAASVGATLVRTIIQQCLQRPGGATGMATLAHANLILSGVATGITPRPMLPGFSGSTHMLPETYKPLGAATAYEIARHLAAGVSVSPPRVAPGSAVLVTSTQIDCTISGGSGVFVLDTVNMPQDAGGTYGVRVYDSGGAVAISSVTMIGSSTLRIVTSAPVLLANSPRVEFGLDGTESQSGAGAARVNIRDSSGWTDPFFGQIVSGWMIHQLVQVTS